MNKLCAFRCPDGTYLLAPNTQASRLKWFANPSVEFLGEVRPDSFERAVLVTIEREISKWSFALVSKYDFTFSWSQAQEPLPDALDPPSRKAAA